MERLLSCNKFVCYFWFGAFCDDTSFLKLVHIFSINPHLGPLQISLGRMIVDILKFFFIYTLVLFAFGCGKLFYRMHCASFYLVLFDLQHKTNN